MKRDYKTGSAEDIVFFTGVEVEKTPAYGLKTLFVTGIQPIEKINFHYQKEKCQHIFFGANHSFAPKSFDDWNDWENMLEYFLVEGYLCSLDIDIKYAEEFLEGGSIEHHNFIPQIRVPLPYTKQWNYNTMIKIDDKDFRASNPGVWCHRLHDLMDPKVYTSWDKYKNDEVLK